ncbi:PH domain-containing protein [Flavobacterium sp. RHBU_3]|uniref:PH domain-containing protein n=1 Tax=Flavobacterium sp. RHBU_3 TaxID=3391184 RepID=UPI00398477F7
MKTPRPMKYDFSRPQRQSLIGILIMSADTLQSSIRALFPIVVVSLFQEKNKYYYVALGLVILVAALVSGYFKYRNFTFLIDEQNREFVVRKGIFSKTRIAIPLNKIQQVNINQNLLQKILKVHALQVDTAGSSKTEVTIKAITERYALVLKERLLLDAPVEEDETGEIVEKKHKPFITISFASLLKTGITSNYIRSFGILLAFFISTWQHLDDFLRLSDTDASFLDEYFNTAFLIRSIAAIITVVLVLTLLVNLGRTVLRFFDFKVTKEDNALLLSHGLINTRNTIIRPEKVQILTVGRNFFQKKFNINDLKIKQASDLEKSNDRSKMQMEIPGVNNAEKDALLLFLLEKMPEKGFEVKPNIRKVIFEIFKYILIPLGLFYGYTKIMPEAGNVIIFVPFYVLFVGILIYFAFRHSRLFITPDFIVRKRGAWDVDNDILMPHKIQSIKLQQFFWQKWSDVGVVKLYTAGGHISFGLANFTQLNRLANYWLYQVETTEKEWM